MSTDLGLDPSDPLNSLHNSSQSADSVDSDASQQFDDVQDWSNLSALWADASGAGSMDPTSKSYADMMPMDFADLSSSMAMDMDFNPSMAIEPSALHYDPMKFANLAGMGMNFAGYDDQYVLSSELLASQFPFTFQFGSDMNGSSASSLASDSDSPQSFTKERRLSVTSSASSSGASSSPGPESLPSPAPGYASDNVQPKKEPSQPTSTKAENPYENDPAAELAARVRQTAGVMLAVPMNAQLQGFDVHLPMANSSQPKLPIPRLPRHNPSAPKSTASTSSSAASTPPPSTPPPSNAPFKLMVNTSAPASGSPDMVSTPVATPGSALPRPKTSHTTIERRYRTNLNARIQSLRMAVPALRVLEDREGGNGKKIKKNLKGSVIVKGSNTGAVEADDGTVDIIDERGFVDGVKVARKCSKANVLGKAVEYIRVLKKREMRLRAEQAGLKMLVSGLVGGPALVREWESEWRLKFGGEERDEVEGEDGEEDEDDSEDDDEDEEGGRKRKRVKVSAAAPVKKVVEKKPVVAASASVAMAAGTEQTGGANLPEKRKRGRPRKVLPPPVTLAPAPSAAPVQQQIAKQEPSSGPMVQDEMEESTAWVQQQQAQAQPQQYLLAVFALFSFFNSPLTSSSSSFASSSRHAHQHTGTVLSSAHPPLAYAPDIISQFAAPSTPAAMPAGWSWQEYVQLFHLAVSVLVLVSFMSSWLGIGLNFGVGRVVNRGRSMSVRSFRKTNAAETTEGKKRDRGPAGWARLGEESVLEGRTSSLSLYERLKIYRAISAKRQVSVSDLTTLAMVVRGSPGVLGGLARVKARFVWETAKLQAQNPNTTSTKVAKTLVFEELDDVDAAVTLLSGADRETTSGDGESKESAPTPLEVIAGLVVKERVKRHLRKLFVRAVASEEETEGEEIEKEEEEKWRKTVDAARELGGRVEELGRMFERVWKVSASSALDGEELWLSLGADNANAEGVDGEIRALFVALVLYRRLFAASTGEEEDGCVTPTPTSALLSPPPSPRSNPRARDTKESTERARMLLALRTALGSRVFEDGEVMKIQGNGGEEREEEEEMGLGLEDAKDRVVDMVYEAGRRERGSSTS